MEKAILSGNSRYPCKSKILEDEIKQYLCLYDSPKGGEIFRDPNPTKLDAITKTLVDAIHQTNNDGVMLIQVMRKITTSTYNYDEFLGDLNTSYRYRNLGCRLSDHSKKYCYVALPNAGPPMRLLGNLQDDPNYGWTQFKEDYKAYLADEEKILAETTGWILLSSANRLLPVLLCCEPFVGCFDQLSDDEMKAYGCHRFLLCDILCRRLADVGLSIQRLNLNPSQVRRRMMMNREK